MSNQINKLIKPELDLYRVECNFTDDEKEVFECMTKGYTLSKTAIECCLSESTVQRRMDSILGKINKVKEWSDLKKEVPISEKYNLTLEEASAYFNIGIDRLREITNENKDEVVLMVGAKRLVKKSKMEKLLDRTFVL